jgi:hypothetical protein
MQQIEAVHARHNDGGLTPGDAALLRFPAAVELLEAKGAAPANLDPFRTLMGSTATGVNPNLIGRRLTNLTQLTLDTSWWTRYRDDSHNPDLDPNFNFPPAVPTLAVNQHTAIPRTDAWIEVSLLFRSSDQRRRKAPPWVFSELGLQIGVSARNG